MIGKEAVIVCFRVVYSGVCLEWLRKILATLDRIIFAMFETQTRHLDTVFKLPVSCEAVLTYALFTY
jgi:hypothetical protein